MAEEQESQDRRVTYWGFTEGLNTGRFYRSEIDMGAVLEDLAQREPEGRILQFEDSNVSLAIEVYKEVGDDEQTMIFMKGTTADLLRLMRGGQIVEMPLDGAAVMHTSWVRFHPENRVGILRGPGGPGKGDLVRCLNMLDPPLLQPPPKLTKKGVPAKRSPQVGLTPMPSTTDAKAMLDKARRVNALKVTVPPDASLRVDESVTRKVTKMLRNAYGDQIVVRLEVSIPRRADRTTGAQDQLRNEVGRLSVDKDVRARKVKVARVNVDQGRQQGVDFDLLEEHVAARVPVIVTARGMLTDGACHEALTEAWSQAEDRIPSGLHEETEEGE